MRILVVEDDPDQRNLLLELLAAHGYDTVGAGSVANALKLLDEQGFNAVVTDFDLRDGTGHEVLQHTRALELPRMVLSGRGPADLPDGLEYLRKPIDFERFLARLGAMVGGAGDTDDHVATAEASAGPDEAPAGATVRLRLYLGANTPSSAAMERRVRAAVADRDDVSLDVFELGAQLQPNAADLSAQLAEDKVMFTPTLIRLAPEPRLWLVGDPGDELLDVLGIKTR